VDTWWLELGNLHSSLLNPTSLPPNMAYQPTSRANMANITNHYFNSSLELLDKAPSLRQLCRA